MPGLCALLGWACTHARPPPAAEEPRVARSYETVTVAPGVHAFIAPEPRVGLVSGNSVAVVGEEAVLVVDSGHFPGLTRRMIGDIRRLTDKPIVFLVNTHWHPDHHSGNGVYRELVPDVTIVSTEYTRVQMEKQAGRFDNPESLMAASRTVRERLASGKKRDGTPLTTDDRRYIQDVLEAIDDAVPELRQVKAAPPDVGFEDRVVVQLGKRTVEVMFLGRGNTGGDAVVYVPDAKVLITGDLVVAPVPYGIGSFFADWIQTMHKLEAIDAAALVPGHGPVQRDKQYLRLVTSLLESVAAQTKAAVQQGLTLEETRAKVDLEGFRERLTGGNPVRVRAFNDAFVTPGVARAWREAKEGALRDED
ncbi:MAG: MBL fold metallo-hydrolase [Myxococcales bacterium]